MKEPNSAKPEIMKAEFARFRERVGTLFRALQDLTAPFGDNELQDVAASLVKNVNSPFLFVVVGEVKSGKSSLINALLGQHLCEVAPDPCTDTIQKIVHAPEKTERTISDQVREIGRPLDILREIAIVDTPGTNSIIEKHQEITERFIPESDLVMFVFSAVNPYSKTAWDLFQLVHARWHKKIIFILQQADRATPEELSVNKRRVHEHALELGIADPNVFCVSAKAAMEGREDSGLEKVWEFIKDTVTGGRHYLLKMESLLSTAVQVLKGVEERLELLREGLRRDQAEAGKIRGELQRNQDISLREVEVLKAGLIQAYTRIADDTIDEFESGLSVPNLVKSSLKGMVSRRNSFKEWLEGLTVTFNDTLTREVDRMSRDTSQHIARHIVRTMEDLLSELKETGLKRPRDNLSSVTRRRLAVVDEILVRLTALMRGDSMSERLRPTGLRKIGDQALLGGFISVIGAIIAGAAHAAVFDVTGGIVTTIGAVLALNTIVFKRRSVVRKFKSGFQEGKETFHDELETRLTEQVTTIYAELEDTFTPLFENIEQRKHDLDRLEKEIAEVRSGLTQEREAVEKMHRE